MWCKEGVSGDMESLECGSKQPAGAWGSSLGG